MDVAHCDVKMDNLLLRTSPDATGFCSDDIVLSDFGYSKMKRNQEFVQDELPGTREFMAPELLTLRLEKRELTQQLLDAAAAKNEELARVKAAYDNGPQDSVASAEAWEEVKELAPSVWCEFEQSQRVEKTACAMLSWHPCDIYSASIVIWKLFHANDTPFPEIAHFPEPMREKKTHTLLTGESAEDSEENTNVWRPDLLEKVNAALRMLWQRVLAEGLLVRAWQTNPNSRPGAAELHRMVKKVLSGP